MGKLKVEKPWTWDEIAALRKPEADEQRERFVAEYGDQGIAAIVAAGHEPGTWAQCPFDPEMSAAPCRTCPLYKWREQPSWWRTTSDPRRCSEAAMEVYTRMVEKMGVEGGR